MSDRTISRVVFSYDGGRPLLPPSIRSARFRYVSADDDRASFDRAVRAALEGTLDRRDRERIADEGVDAVAHTYLDVPQGRYVVHLPDWYSVWLDGDLIGFTQPLRGANDWDDHIGFIGALGVLPAFRGNEYGMDLVAFATATLLNYGVEMIMCHADVSNAPLIHALKRIGYTSAAPA